MLKIECNIEYTRDIYSRYTELHTTYTLGQFPKSIDFLIVQHCNIVNHYSKYATVTVVLYYTINVVNTIQQIWFNAKNRMQYTKTFTAGRPTSMSKLSRCAFQTVIQTIVSTIQKCKYYSKYQSQC